MGYSRGAVSLCAGTAAATLTSTMRTSGAPRAAIARSRRPLQFSSAAVLLLSPLLMSTCCTEVFLSAAGAAAGGPLAFAAAVVAMSLRCNGVPAHAAFSSSVQQYISADLQKGSSMKFVGGETSGTRRKSMSGKSEVRLSAETAAVDATQQQEESGSTGVRRDLCHFPVSDTLLKDNSTVASALCVLGRDQAGFLSPVNLRPHNWYSNCGATAGKHDITGVAGNSLSKFVASVVSFSSFPSLKTPSLALFADAEPIVSPAKEKPESDVKAHSSTKSENNYVFGEREDDKPESTCSPPTEHSAFQLKWSANIPELRTEAALYEHRETGAKLMSLSVGPEEKEKVFAVGFRTPVHDSMGMPHIMEHALLGGSKKYPVKEPMAELIKGSLYSFLNAMTYSTYTLYEVASVNLKDFYNLASVYIDGIMQPLAVETPHILLQEGWRLEATLLDEDVHESTASPTKTAVAAFGKDEKDVVGGVPTSEKAVVTASAKSLKDRVKLEFQGVVLNEMKGVFSRPEALLHHVRMANLFPNVDTYRFESGGMPSEITSLTFEKFKKFYDSHYHPSNAKILFWGSDDVYSRLQFVHEYLHSLEVKRSFDIFGALRSAIPKQPAFDKPRQVVEKFQSPSETLEDMVTVDWILDPSPSQCNGNRDSDTNSEEEAPWAKPLSAEDRIALVVLEHLLLGSAASPLYRALLRSNIGKEVLDIGLSEYKQVVFGVGLKGIPQHPKDANEEGDAEKEPTSVEKVESIVLETLKKCSEEGFPPDAVEASLNTIEFRWREFNTGRYPKGLVIIMNIMSDWVNDRWPLLSIQFEKPLLALRRRVENKEPVFQDLIKRYFLSNPHRVTVLLQADHHVQAKAEEEEFERLEEIREKLSEEDVRDMVQRTAEFKQKQLKPDAKEALETIPTLTLDDIEEGEEIPTEVADVCDGAAKLLMHRLPSVGVAYLDWMLPLHSLRREELQLLPFFSSMLTETGTSNMDEEELAHHIGMHTGGVSAFIDIRSVGKDPTLIPEPEDTLGFLVLSGKAMNNKAEKLIQIMATLLQDANFKNERRGKELLKQLLAATESSVSGSGLLGSIQVQSNFSVAGKVASLIKGIPYLQFLKNLRLTAEVDWTLVERKLEAIRSKLLSGQPRTIYSTKKIFSILNLTGEEEIMKSARDSESSLGKALRQHVHDTLTSRLHKFGVSAYGLNSSEAEGSYGSQEQRELGETNKGEEDSTDLRAMPTCDWAFRMHGRLFDEYADTEKPIGFIIPSTVNYVFLGGRLQDPGEKRRGQFAVAAEALSNGPIFERVRIAAGAYGAWFRTSGGIYLFSSYRDPQLVQTLQHYRSSIADLRRFAEELDERALTRSIIAVVRSIDQPTLPDRKGYTAAWRFLSGETAEHRKTERAEVMSTTKKDFLTFIDQMEQRLQEIDADSSPDCEEGYAKNIVAVVGSSKAFEQAREEEAAAAAAGRKSLQQISLCPLHFQLVSVKAYISSSSHADGNISSESAEAGSEDHEELISKQAERLDSGVSGSSESQIPVRGVSQ